MHMALIPKTEKDALESAIKSLLENDSQHNNFHMVKFRTSH